MLSWIVWFGYGVSPQRPHVLEPFSLAVWSKHWDEIASQSLAFINTTHHGFIIRQPFGEVVETRMWGIPCRKWVTGNTSLNMRTRGTTFPVIPAEHTVCCLIAVSNSPVLCISVIPFHHDASALLQLKNNAARWQWRKRNLNTSYASVSGIFQWWVTQGGHQTCLV